MGQPDNTADVIDQDQEHRETKNGFVKSRGLTAEGRHQCYYVLLPGILARMGICLVSSRKN
jgi:hypothetical protein